MLRLTDFKNSQRWHWCSVVVLIAAISLTVSLATRYSSVQACSDPAAITVQKASTPDQVRQRLLDNAATWIPPLISAVLLDTPAPYTRVAPAEPVIIEPFFEKNLCNRPPPFLNPYFS